MSGSFQLCSFTWPSEYMDEIFLLIDRVESNLQLKLNQSFANRHVQSK